MNPSSSLLLFVLASFLVGAIPFGWIVFRIREGRDIRTVGSGNIGATNVFRFGGRRWGVLVMVLDVLKGTLPALIARALYGVGTEAALVGGAAVFGHCFTPYLKFRGGKGVATGLGALIVLAPIPLLIAILVFVVTVALTHYVSLGSIVAAVVAPVVACLFGGPLAVRLVIAMCCALIVTRHHSNIRKLLAGTEGRIGSRHPSEPA